MSWFPCPYLNGAVELKTERERHRADAIGSLRHIVPENWRKETANGRGIDFQL